MTKFSSRFFRKRAATRYVICFGIDDAYVWPLLIALYSAKKYWPEFNQVTIGYDSRYLSGVSQKLIHQFTKKIDVKVKFMKIELNVGSFKNNQHISDSALLRINILGNLKDKIIWFDSDILFLSRWSEIVSLSTSTEFSEEILIARKHWEVASGVFSDSNQAFITCKKEYFNSGVLIINPPRFRDAYPQSKLQIALDNYTNLGFQWADQCVLNYLTEGNYVRLNKIYNSVPAEYSANQTRILHFAGSEKPWQFSLSKEGLPIENPRKIDLQYFSQEEVLPYLIYRSLEDEVLIMVQSLQPIL